MTPQFHSSRNADIVLGAPTASFNGPGSGAVFVVPGQPALPPTISLTDAIGENAGAIFLGTPGVKPEPPSAVPVTSTATRTLI